MGKEAAETKVDGTLEGTLHGAGPNLSSRRVDESVAIAVGEDLEIGDGIGDVLKGRIGDPQLETERFPLGPVGAGLVGSRRNDSQGTF
eukprot:scaffold23366_cov215-Cylindrotheca_fusiformis.AAC.2